MANGYKLMASRDRHEGTSNNNAAVRFASSRQIWTAFFGAVSVLNLCILFTSLAMWRAAVVPSKSSSATANSTLDVAPASIALATLDSFDRLARVAALPIVHIPFYWNTPWGSPNTTESDPLWNNINTAHGHIAIDHDWAAANNWSPSMDIPGKPGKGMYLLQAYHQLHCLRIVRSTLLSLHRSTPPTYPMHHALHCFDALRQHIMCHADNTPLYGHGNGMAGDGQLHKCKDWSVLRDYATQNTACFRDGKPGMTFEDRFRVCDDGTDGLEAYAPGHLG